MLDDSRLLTKNEEFQLIKNWKKNKDKKSLRRIISAYKRMPNAYARKYARYGIPFEDLVNEARAVLRHQFLSADVDVLPDVMTFLTASKYPVPTNDWCFTALNPCFAFANSFCCSSE